MCDRVSGSKTRPSIAFHFLFHHGRPTQERSSAHVLARSRVGEPYMPLASAAALVADILYMVVKRLTASADDKLGRSGSVARAELGSRVTGSSSRSRHVRQTLLGVASILKARCTSVLD